MPFWTPSWHRIREAGVACETLVTTGQVVLAGEVTTEAYIDAAQIARDTIKEIGYTHPEIGFDYQSCGVLTAIHSQSPDIARGVDNAEDNDQGTRGRRPGPDVRLRLRRNAGAHAAADSPGPSHRRTAGRGALQEANFPGSAPTARARSPIEYVNERPDARSHGRRLARSTMNRCWTRRRTPSAKKPSGRSSSRSSGRCIPKKLWNDDIIFHINPTGKFVVGGPHGDTGLTGRKIIVDSYGGRGAHGGGAFSGKDPCKVDRGACYMGRYIAKNIVAARPGPQCRGAAGLRDRRRAIRCRVTVSTENTAVIPEDQIAGSDQGAFPADAARDHQASGSAAADLQADRPPRPFRPPARTRRRFQLGKDRQGRGPGQGRGNLDEKGGMRGKFEIRNSEFESNSNDEVRNGRRFFIRISNFEFSYGIHPGKIVANPSRLAKPATSVIVVTKIVAD